MTRMLYKESIMDISRQNKEKNFWDKFAPKYDLSMKNAKKPTYDLLIRKIKTYLDTSKDVLEVAAGTGVISLEIAPYVNKVCGCDLSSEMIKVAGEKLKRLNVPNIEFSVQDAYNLEYERESFDVVIASNALHVMMNPEMALASIRTVLKPDGVFIVPTYCHGNSVKSRIFSAVMSLAGFKAYHKWSMDSFKIFLETDGYEIIEFELIRDKIPLAFAVVKKSKS